MEKIKNRLIFETQYDVEDFFNGEGKSDIFPEMLIACEQLLYNELRKNYCVTIKSTKTNAMVDFFVDSNYIDFYLDEIYKWAEDTENYEMCERVNYLKKYMEKKLNDLEV